MSLLARTPARGAAAADAATPARPAPARRPAHRPRRLGPRPRDGHAVRGDGGREGWIRTALTAAGVALGVAVLLLGASVPSLLDSWHGREKARENLGQAHDPRPADDTVLYTSADTTFHGAPIRGRLVRPDGTHPPVPPGIGHLPGPGRMLVSPALDELLASPDGALLRDRLDYEVAGVIGDEGLQRPAGADLPRAARHPPRAPTPTASTTSARAGSRRRCGRPSYCW